MGRPTSRERAEARDAGLRFFTATEPCERCFDNLRYVSNAQCVSCLIVRGKARYAALDPDQQAERQRRDHARYLARRARAIPAAVVDDSDFV